MAKGAAAKERQGMNMKTPTKMSTNAPKSSKKK